MGFKDLVELKKRENRLILILVFWLLAGFTAVQFRTTRFLGIAIFIPLLGFLFILLLAHLIFREKLKELTFKSILKYIIIAIPLFLVFYLIIVFSVIILIGISIISYIIITSFFTLHNCYKWGVDLDEKLYKMPRMLNFFLRIIAFIGGLALAIIIMLLIANIGFKSGVFPEDVVAEIEHIPWLMISLFIVLFFIGSIFLFIGKFNAWLGIFLLYVAGYSSYLIFKTSFSLMSTEESLTALPIQISLYFFDLFLLLITMGSLIGKKAEIISKKLKFIKFEVIIIWLVFSKSAYEFTFALPTPDEGASVSSSFMLISFIIFIPLFLSIGFYGIVNYFKLKKQRKTEKKAKKLTPIEFENSRITETTKSETMKQKTDTILKTREETLICPSCSAINRLGAKFCGKCGSDLK
ncbi:MAG: zinc ribbon domain-containing protein [Promethearchaeota archaeon]